MALVLPRGVIVWKGFVSAPLLAGWCLHPGDCKRPVSSKSTHGSIIDHVRYNWTVTKNDVRLDTLLVRKCHGLDFVQATTSFANALGLGDTTGEANLSGHLSWIESSIDCLVIIARHQWTTRLPHSTMERTSTPQAKVARCCKMSLHQRLNQTWDLDSRFGIPAILRHRLITSAFEVQLQVPRYSWHLVTSKSFQHVNIFEQ